MQLHNTPGSEFAHDLAAILPERRFSHDAADRLIYSRDMWPKSLLAVRDNKPSVHPPDYIVWPQNTEELVNIVKLAIKHRVPLVPYGGGSGVCGGAMASSGGVVVDLKRMDRRISVSVEDQLATFQAGINGQLLEDQLNLHGLTLGHFPSSIYCSTLGGWLAARSAGQFSSRYGKIEDMAHEMEVVLGDGRVVQLGVRHEPDLMPLFIGSEGTLGIITQATMRVHPLPEQRIFRAYLFPRVSAGCEAMRRIMQRGLRPSVMRLYDELDTLITRPNDKRAQTKRFGSLGALKNMVPQLADLFRGDMKGGLLRALLSRAGLANKLVDRFAPRLSGGCLAIIGVEGDAELARTEAALCDAECRATGGVDIGEEAGLTWYENRYSVSYKMSPLYTSGAFVDTMEVATTWERLLDLYQAVRKAIAPHVVVLAHFSHAYAEGCSIYFTFAGFADGRVKSDTLYDTVWRDGLSAVVKAGGTISHHHGVGQSKAAFMNEEHGAGMGIYRKVKAVSDPYGILNPGKMGL